MLLQVEFDPVSGQLLSGQGERQLPANPTTAHQQAQGHTWADQVSGQLLSGQAERQLPANPTTAHQQAQGHTWADQVSRQLVV